MSRKPKTSKRLYATQYQHRVVSITDYWQEDGKKFGFVHISGEEHTIKLRHVVWLHKTKNLLRLCYLFKVDVSGMSIQSYTDEADGFATAKLGSASEGTLYFNKRHHRLDKDAQP